MTETSQIKKVSQGLNTSRFLVILLGVVFILTSVAAVAAVNYHLQDYALSTSQVETRLILDRNLATHTYFAHNLKPAIFELTEPYLEEDYFDPVWMSSTYAVRMIDNYYQSLSPANYYYKEAAINARSEQNEADAYERTFIDQLNQDPSLEIQSEIREINGIPYYTTLRRGEVMEESCLRCHSVPGNAPAGLVDMYGSESSFGRQEDEVISAISIGIPLDETYQKIGDLTWTIALIIISALVMLFIVLNFVRVRLLIAPVKKIGKQALLIVEHSEYLGEQITLPAFLEMRQLVEAFNVMSTSLSQEHRLLQQRVRERTAALVKANKKIEFMANHDELTGLPNRRLFDEHIKQALRLARRDKKQITLMMIDLDNYKQINDAHGHLVGDEVIKTVGSRFVNVLRESDLVSRWGGDEFTIVLFAVSQRDEVETVLEKIFSAFEEPIVVGENSFVVRMSIGVAHFPVDGEEAKVLLRHADAAMFQAKKNEGNSYCFYQGEIGE